jgi:hypothetical protein
MLPNRDSSFCRALFVAACVPGSKIMKKPANVDLPYSCRLTQQPLTGPPTHASNLPSLAPTSDAGRRGGQHLVLSSPFLTPGILALRLHPQSTLGPCGTVSAFAVGSAPFPSADPTTAVEGWEQASLLGPKMGSKIQGIRRSLKPWLACPLKAGGGYVTQCQAEATANPSQSTSALKSVCRMTKPNS